jgi:hypothetical protein
MTTLFEKFNGLNKELTPLQGILKEDPGQCKDLDTKKAIEDLTKRWIAVMLESYDVAYAQYRAGGLAYGDSAEGFRQWAEELDDRDRARLMTHIGNTPTK